ncbi:MAG: OmpH family outer membrane protein [Phascolarctobacterium sp.]|nr:OmpH family outer membrane protein [Phascolarctobacterium sp.]
MKKIVAGLMVVAAMLTFGCGGRNSDFGVVDMRKVEKEATVIKTVQTDLEKQIKELREKAIKDSEGKAEEEQRKIAEDFQAKAKLAQSEAQNKVKASVDSAMNAVAKEKNLGAILLKDAVPQGGKDVTADVIAKMAK